MDILSGEISPIIKNKLALVEFYEIQRWDPGKNRSCVLQAQLISYVKAKKLQVEIFSKKPNVSKNIQPTKTELRAGFIYTLVLHFVLSKQSCISSNKTLC